MKILGYIVTERKMNGIESFVGQVNDISLADPTKPKLIIGWKNAKSRGDYRSILEWELCDNTYWTFSKSENRSYFDRDLEKFYKIVIDYACKSIKYYYINIFKLRYGKLKKLYNIVNSSVCKNIYIDNKMVYVPYGNSNILGLSLQILSYCGIKSQKVMARIFNNSQNKHVDSFDKDVIKIGRRLQDKKYAIPLLI